MDKVWLEFNGFWGAARIVDWVGLVKVAFELIIIGYAAIWIWSRIKGTQAERLVKGVMVLFTICILSWVTGLTLITAVLQQLIPVFVLALLIIFQPEIRRGLGYLGKSAFRVDLSIGDTDKERGAAVIKQIISAVRELSRTKTGALIVIEPPEGERDYLSPGTTINADVSAPLLIAIFLQTSPLHDGAVIIRQNKIVAAGVILPMTESPKLSQRYGTRHRAAIGLSEVYDGLCVVVSEETGAISAANRGMLVKYNTAEDLADPLSYVYYHGTVEAAAAKDTPFHSFLSMFGRRATKSDTGRSGSEPTQDKLPVVPPAGGPARNNAASPATAAGSAPGAVKQPAAKSQAIDATPDSSPAANKETDDDARPQTTAEPV